MEAADLQILKYAVEDSVATLTLNRLAQKNALDMVMRAELAQVIAAARRDRGIHALIFSSAGGAVCAGGDIRGMRSGDPTGEEGRGRMLDLHLWVEELINFDRPVIAAVDGPAYGTGFGLALAADFVLATPRVQCVDQHRSWSIAGDGSGRAGHYTVFRLPSQCGRGFPKQGRDAL